MRFVCENCDTELESDWLAEDDWIDGIPIGIGPDCPECEEEMVCDE